jgi:hypothetical protein
VTHFARAEAKFAAPAAVRVILHYIRAPVSNVPLLTRLIERKTPKAFDLSNGVFDRPRRIVSLLVRPGGLVHFLSRLVALKLRPGY